MPTLGQVIRDLLCEVARGDYKKCNCDQEFGVQTYRCAYGDCEIIRCRRCHRIVNVLNAMRNCRFPYSR